MSSEILKYLEFFKEMGVEYVRLDVGGHPQVSATSVRSEPGRQGDAPMPDRNDMLQLALSAPLPFARSEGREPRSPMTVEEQASQMKEVRDDLGDCVRCKLHRYRTQIVFGTGNIHAELMFVGEAPGADEDEQGIPFVGRAGQLLTKIIESIGLRREDVYIANIIKCRPPQNRNPEPDEIAECSPFLLRQIEVIQPRIVCALGKFAAQTLLNSQAPISQLRGKFFDGFGAKVIPTFHPSYLLRNPAGKREVWEDMKAIRRLLNERN